jgi:hypothetical protein
MAIYWSCVQEPCCVCGACDARPGVSACLSGVRALHWTADPMCTSCYAFLQLYLMCKHSWRVLDRHMHLLAPVQGLCKGQLCSGQSLLSLRAACVLLTRAAASTPDSSMLAGCSGLQCAASSGLRCAAQLHVARQAFFIWYLAAATCGVAAMQTDHNGSPQTDQTHSHGLPPNLPESHQLIWSGDHHSTCHMGRLK